MGKPGLSPDEARAARDAAVLIISGDADLVARFDGFLQNIGAALGKGGG